MSVASSGEFFTMFTDRWGVLYEVTDSTRTDWVTLLTCLLVSSPFENISTAVAFLTE